MQSVLMPKAFQYKIMYLLKNISAVTEASFKNDKIGSIKKAMEDPYC